MPSVSCDRDIINYITLGELLKVTGYLQDFQTLRKSCLRCTTSRSRSACHQFAKWHTESFERKDPQGKVEIQFHGHYKEIFPFYEPLTEMTEKVCYCFWIPVRFVRGMTGLFSCNELAVTIQATGKQKRSSESTYTYSSWVYKITFYKSLIGAR